MSLPSKEQILSAIAKTRELVPAPRTLGRALQLLRQPDSGLTELAQLIGSDPALAAGVLRCANSAFHHRKAKVSTLEEALQVIGFSETIRLVSLVAAHQTTHHDLGSYGIGADDFWAESLFSGVFVETLARRTVTGDPGEAYTAGLLRFVGRLTIDQALQNLGASLFWDESLPLVEWERENVGLTHAEVGARLFELWELPPTLIQAIAGQDDANPPDPSSAEPLVQCLHFASQLLPAGRTGAQLEAPMPAPDAAVLLHPYAATRSLGSDDLVEMLEDSRTRFVTLRDSLHR